MATVTAQGITPTTLAEYTARMGTIFRDALGDDLSLATETPQGQMIDGLSILFAELDEVIVAIGNSFSLDRASGVAQDDQADLLNITRRRASRSTVTVTATGVPETVIPAGSRVATPANDVFASTVAATIPTGGSIDVAMESEELGAIVATAGSLTLIVDVIAGWETVTNAAAATLGDTEETQVEFRLRYRRHAARNALTYIQALESRILGVPGVVNVLVRDNSTDASVTEQGQDIDAGSIYCAVQGGTDAAVADAIFRAKTPGISTVGATTETITQTDTTGVSVGTVDINFDRVVEVPITVSFDITPGDTFPSDGIQQINDGLVDYIARQTISDPVDSTRILTPILAVPGHTTGTITIARKTSGTGTPAAWDTNVAYVINDLVVDALRSGTGNTVYRAVAASTGTDPSAETDDTNRRAVGATLRADILLFEKLTLAAADITITPT